MVDYRNIDMIDYKNNYEKIVALKDGRKMKLLYLSKMDFDPRYFEEIGQYDIEVSSRIYLCHQIIAISEAGQKIGSCWFAFEDNACELHQIEIYDKNFINSGVGTLMIKEMEQLAVQEKCEIIFGGYGPFGPFKDYSEDFYIRNGYKIFKKEERIQKILEEQPNKSSAENGNQRQQKGE